MRSFIQNKISLAALVVVAAVSFSANQGFAKGTGAEAAKTGQLAVEAARSAGLLKSLSREQRAALGTDVVKSLETLALANTATAKSALAAAKNSVKGSALPVSARRLVVGYLEGNVEANRVANVGVELERLAQQGRTVIQAEEAPVATSELKLAELRREFEAKDYTARQNEIADYGTKLGLPSDLVDAFRRANIKITADGSVCGTFDKDALEGFFLFAVKFGEEAQALGAAGNAALTRIAGERGMRAICKGDAACEVTAGERLDAVRDNCGNPVAL